MNFEQRKITLYDPENRGVDLVSELAPFFQCNESWTNCRISGNYLSCAKYIVTRRLIKLGLMILSRPDEVDTISSNSFELILCAGMAIQKGYVFPEDEMSMLREFSRTSQIMLGADLPNDPMYDSVREQFNLTRKALDCFK
jgi:hypothetical protein